MLVALIVSLGAWIAFIVFARFVVAPWLSRLCGGKPLTGFMAGVVRIYCWLLHRPRYEGQDSLRAQLHAGPLVIVSNHTAGIDPLLIQSACRFHIRWMMATHMMAPALDWLWKLERMIPVRFDSSDSTSAREAIRHLQEGGVLGVFPEGGIERPPCRLMPFLAGVGLIVSRTEAPVLLTWVSGTPACDSAFASLITPSESRVLFLEVVRYPKRTRPAEIVDDLRRRLAHASGWPVVDERAEPASDPVSA